MANQPALTPSFTTFTYERHRSEETPLSALTEEHYPRFLERLEAAGSYASQAPRTQDGSCQRRGQSKIVNTRLISVHVNIISSTLRS